jgi:hypothetical protein
MRIVSPSTTPSAIWGYSTRELSSDVELTSASIDDIWTRATRALTEAVALTSGAVDDIWTRGTRGLTEEVELTNAALHDIWTYTTRQLTTEVSLNQDGDDERVTISNMDDFGFSTHGGLAKVFCFNPDINLKLQWYDDDASTWYTVWSNFTWSDWIYVENVSQWRVYNETGGDKDILVIWWIHS